MVAGAVRPGLGRLVFQFAKDLQLILVVLQGTKGAAPREVGARAFGPPGGGDSSVREIDERRPERHAGGSARQPRGGSVGQELVAAQRLEQWQSDAGADAAEEGAP